MIQRQEAGERYLYASDTVDFTLSILHSDTINKWNSGGIFGEPERLTRDSTTRMPILLYRLVQHNPPFITRGYVFV